MAQMELAGNMYEVDENGFMQETDRWTEDVARAYAAKEGVNEVTKDHWTAIYYLRNYYLQNGICPMIRRLIKETGFNLSRLYELFPQGPAQSACKWAGVPKPTGCV
jgi:TusE/DsrC/DsvC family sulfur relay protein